MLVFSGVDEQADTPVRTGGRARSQVLGFVRFLMKPECIQDRRQSPVTGGTGRYILPVFRGYHVNEANAGPCLRE